MKNILFMLDYYLPNASANGVCAEGLIHEFAKNGVNVSVLSIADKDSFSESGNIKYYTAKKPVLKKKNPRIDDTVFYLRWLLPSRYPLTERKEFTELFTQNGREIIRRDNIDTVVCIHFPAETLIAAQQLKKEFPNVNFVAYMLDSMSGGHMPRFLPQKITRSKAARWENRLFRICDKIILTETSKKHHLDNSITTNWICKAAFLGVPLLIEKQTQNKIEKNGKIRISFCGLLDYPYRNVFKMIDIVKKMHTNVEFVLVGKSNVADKLSAISAEDERIIYKGQVPHSEVEKIILSSDILMNYGVKTPSAISGKIFEYMSYAKPIITTYSIDNEACLPYMEKYPLALTIDERIDDVEAQAHIVDEFITESLDKKLDYATVEDIFYTSTPKAFYEILDSTF